MKSINFHAKADGIKGETEAKRKTADHLKSNPNIFLSSNLF